MMASKQLLGLLLCLATVDAFIRKKKKEEVAIPETPLPDTSSLGIALGVLYLVMLIGSDGVRWLSSGDKILIRLTVVVAYYVLACVVFIPLEGWSVLTTCYYATVTVTTVGYSDVSPATPKGKVFAMVFITFGLAFVFNIIAAIAGDVLDRAQRSILDHAFVDHHHGAKVLLSVAMLASCVACGAAFFMFSGEFEGDLLDAVWWSFVTVTTVG